MYYLLPIWRCVGGTCVTYCYFIFSPSLVYNFETILHFIITRAIQQTFNLWCGLFIVFFLNITDNFDSIEPCSVTGFFFFILFNDSYKWQCFRRFEHNFLNIGRNMIPLSFPLIFFSKGLLRYLYWFLTFWLILLLSLCLSYGSMMILFSSFY